MCGDDEGNDECLEADANVVLTRQNCCVNTVGKPITQLIQSFSKGRKASLLIFSTIVGVSDTDTCINPCFVDVEPTAVKF